MPSLPRAVCFIFAGACLVARLQAQPFYLPTANTAVVQPGAEDRAFAATPGKTWVSGTFGCVRSGGWQLHEGLDIRSIQHDRHGEPTDPVMATADGVIMYINTRPSLSNYGNYIVIRHVIEGMEIYSLYAHLSRVASGMHAGLPVKAGQVIAIMGRTSNTSERIGKDRAHVHFELNLFENDHFASWFRRNCPGERNDHDIWNGRNLTGFDPRLVFLAEQQLGPKFSVVQFIRSRTELCRVLVRVTDFPWLHRYPQLIRPNPVAQKEGVAGYEIALDFNVLPFELIPRAASEIKGSAKFQLLSVNDAEETKNPARRLVVNRGGRWELGPHGLEELSLLTD